MIDSTSNTEKAIAVQELATTASSQRRLIWNRAAALLVDVQVLACARQDAGERIDREQNRLSEEHVSSSLRNAKQGTVLYSSAVYTCSHTMNRYFSD
jgi:hypothetical protein